MASKTAGLALATLAFALSSGALAEPEPPAVPAVPVVPADPPAPAELMKWTFSYTGPRVSARGVLETPALPEPDGSYRIVSITGKRNGRRIVELVPAGDMVTDHTMLFADNRLLPASPFVGEGGFSYRTSNKQYFNVCHAVEEGQCGWKGYREFDGRRAGRPISLELSRVVEPTTAPAPEPRVATDVP
jgi:hypothetical protein